MSRLFRTPSSRSSPAHLARSEAVPVAGATPAPGSAARVVVAPGRIGRTTAAVVVALIGASPVAAAPVSVAPVSIAPLAVTPDAAGPAAGRYIVRLVDVAETETRRIGVERSSPSVRAGERRARQHAVADAAGVGIERSFSLTMNGFTAELSAAQAAALRADPRVADLEPDRISHVQAAPSAEALNLSGYGGVWDRLGGASAAGEGVVIGVLDSGIAPENPSFAGDALSSSPGDEPYRDGDEIVYRKADGGEFRGRCEAGEQFDADDCSQTLVGARAFLDGIDTAELGDADVGEYRSPRDGSGHGSHTAAIAAGRPTTARVAEQSQQIAGVAPAAKIAAYKVCWSGPDPSSTGDDACPSSAIIAGVEQAVADGVNVINYSVGAPPEKGVALSAVDEAFLGASNAGVFVAAAAGNGGPRSGGVSNTAPWVTTVAASVGELDQATVRLSPTQAMPGSSVSVPESGTLSGPLQLAPFIGDGKRAINCAPGSLRPDDTDGAVVVCERRGSDSIEAMADEVARAGGVALVALNVDERPTEVGESAVPTVNLPVRYRTSMKRAAAQGDPVATIERGNTTSMPAPAPGTIRSDSSRGPAQGAAADVLKPDVAAPGTGIFSATANASGERPAAAAMSGTSMAAPHIAGLAALVLGREPRTSPAAIKSALVSTADPAHRPDGD
ncbi:S8 family serine peptidase [Mycetocola reblochoni]|uniref:S8 family serine peptidase n=1 Tax=Mycetocola reblochoni TaxID=331618 RepID=UPI0015C58C2B|nr:S8 family serine peptidase [Mycetocola reblochoni]